MFGCAGSLLLCGLFSSCREWGLLSGCGARAVGRTSFSGCSSPALEHRLNSCIAWLSCSILCGSSRTRAQICVSCHWQVDSFLLSHQGSLPKYVLLAHRHTHSWMYWDYAQKRDWMNSSRKHWISGPKLREVESLLDSRDWAGSPNHNCLWVWI